METEVEKIVEEMLRDFSHSGDMKEALKVVIRHIEAGNVAEIGQRVIGDKVVGEMVVLIPAFKRLLEE